MTLHPPEAMQFTVGAQRQEVMLKDGTAITLHPVFNRGAPCAHHRALYLHKGAMLLVDLRRLVPQIGEDICLAAPRDVPGIVFYTLRHHFTTAELLLRAANACGSVLSTPQAEAA